MLKIDGFWTSNVVRISWRGLNAEQKRAVDQHSKARAARAPMRKFLQMKAADDGLYSQHWQTLAMPLADQEVHAGIVRRLLSIYLCVSVREQKDSDSCGRIPKNFYYINQLNLEHSATSEGSHNLLPFRR